MAGSTLGKYQLVAELGRGGMADVFLAVATGKQGLGFSKLVVIKRLREHLANDADFVGMLVDEARIAARLNHPNVVQMLEIDEVGGEYFLAMEYLDGQPLRRIQQRKGEHHEFTKFMEYAILEDALGGLHHAHELADYDGAPLQVVHRDVTPHNIFLTYDGQVKVVDFGIAKAIGRASETRHGIIKGKVPYMAPEQAAGKVVDRRADIFAAGVMLWETAVGRRMWQGVSEIDTLRALVRGNVPSSPREAEPSVPDALDAICRRALAANRDERYATAAEMQADIGSFLSSYGSRPSNRDIGKVVAEMFADKREETKLILDEQLARLREQGAAFRPGKVPQGPLSLSHPASDSDGDGDLRFDESGISISVSAGGEASRPEHAKALPVATEDAPPSAGSTLASPVPPAPRRGRLYVLVGIAVSCVVALAVGASLRAESSKKSAATFAPIPASATGADPSSSAAATAKIVASLRADPPSAHFSVDDGPLLPNPYNGEFTRDASKHRLVVSAPGFATKTLEVSFEDDLSMQTSLARAIDEAPSASSKRR